MSAYYVLWPIPQHAYWGFNNLDTSRAHHPPSTTRPTGRCVGIGTMSRIVRHGSIAPVPPCDREPNLSIENEKLRRACWEVHCDWLYHSPYQGFGKQGLALILQPAVIG